MSVSLTASIQVTGHHILRFVIYRLEQLNASIALQHYGVFWNIQGTNCLKTWHHSQIIHCHLRKILIFSQLLIILLFLNHIIFTHIIDHKHCQSIYGRSNIYDDQIIDLVENKFFLSIFIVITSNCTNSSKYSSHSFWFCCKSIRTKSNSCRYFSWIFSRFSISWILRFLVEQQKLMGGLLHFWDDLQDNK